MTNEELERAVERLHELAKAATPGPWADGPPAWFRGRQNPEDGKRPIQRPGHPGTFANIYGKENAAFIAAANPATILALLSERAELLAAVERVQGALKPFAACADTYADYTPDEAFTDSTDGLTIGECRQARAALTTGEEK